MERIIKAAVDRGASHRHLKAGVFRARINGKLVPLTKGVTQGAGAFDFLNQ